MVSASRVALVALRIWELICSVIVVGILGHFLYIVSDAGATNDGRAVYSLVVASISTVFSLVFIAPFMYSFLAFPVDFALFVMWLVAFCLLETVRDSLPSGCMGTPQKLTPAQRTGIHTCSSPWYWNYWGYYWGGYGSSPGTAGSGYRRSTGAAGSGCGAWRTVLAFSFMAMFAFLVSTILVSSM